MSYLRKNFAFGDLASGITGLSTQITMSVGHTLPTSAGQFVVVVWNMDVYNNPADDPYTEIMVAQYSGTPNIYNVTRGQESTTQVAHPAGAQVAMHLTAGVSEDVVAHAASHGASGSDPIANASTTVKGIASFNPSNFSVASGVVSLVAGGGLAHGSLSSLDYASAGHTGFEPTVTKGNLTAGSTKISIGGTGTGALIGSGASIDVVEANLSHNNLGSNQGGTTSEYYHLTSAEHGYVSGVNAQSVLTTANPSFAGVTVGTILVNASTALAIAGHIANSNFYLGAYTHSDTANHAPLFYVAHWRGTQVSPTVTLDGDELGGLAFQGYSVTGASGRNAAEIRAYADGEWDTGGDTSDNPGRLVFNTTTDGSSSPSEKMRLTSAGYLGIGSVSPLAQLHVGAGTVLNSVDTACAVIRNVSSGSGNAHGFSDSSNVSRAGGIGYCAFDGRFVVSGTEDFDHIVSFQAAPTYSSSGTLTACYGVYVANPTKTAGIITTNYGLYIEDQTVGVTNYAIYAAGSSNSRFDGSVGIGGSPTTRLSVDNGTTAGRAMLVNADADGGDVNQTICNDYVNTASIDETCSITLSFGANVTACQIMAGKEEDFMSSANRSSWLKLRTRNNGTITDAIHITAAGNVGVNYTAGTHKLSVNGTSAFGDGGTTDYSGFEADGTLVFTGAATVWNDANVGAMTLSLPVANQPDEVQFKDNDGDDTGIYSWGFAIGEKVSGAIEIPHDYKEGSNITFHVHWQGIAAPAGGTDNVKWQLTYAVGHSTDALADATTIVKEVAVTTQYGFKRTDFDAIVGTAFDIGDQFLFTLERIAAGSDDYAGDCIVSTVGFHYECDTVGSRTITTK